MPTRTHSWPAGHWDWPIHLTHKHGLACGPMIFVGGQVDLDERGAVRHAGDLAAQTAEVMAYIGRVLADLGAGMDDLVKLVAFYVDDGGGERELLTNIAKSFRSAPGPAVTTIPLPALAYPGMVVEIEAIAMRGPGATRLARRAAIAKGLPALPPPLSHALRCGEMIYVGGQAAIAADGSVVKPGDMAAQTAIVMDRIAALLAEFGAAHDDVVKIDTCYLGQGTVADWEVAARIRARYYTEPGPAATGLPVPRHHLAGLVAKTEVVAMLGEDGRRLPRRHVWPEGHWDWPIHLPYKHGIQCGNVICVGGQVALSPQGDVLAPGDMVAQTRVAMANIRKVLEGFGAGLDDIVKVNAFYVGGASGDALHENLRIRSGSFREPGPTTTGIPLPVLAYPDMMIEIEAMAMI